jgi:lysophospholipid acyltransferase (LPLAT)-like uncharacterized protein
VRRFSAIDDLLLWSVAILGAALLYLLGKSCRLTTVIGEDALEELQRDPRPVLIASWHNQSILVAYFVLRHLQRCGMPVAILASHSRDGELAGRVGRILGFKQIRGSSSRGGALAMRHLYKAVIESKLSPALVPDGPRGPIYRCKPGIVALAQLTGAPILRIGAVPDRAWRLGSWDRLIIPKPFAKIGVGVAPPQSVDRKLPDDDLEAACTELDVQLNELTSRVQKALDSAHGGQTITVQPSESTF